MYPHSLIIDNIKKGNNRIYENIKSFSFESNTTSSLKKYIFPPDNNESKHKTSVNFFHSTLSSLSTSTKEQNENFQEIKNFTIIHQKHYW
jgi:hypothetical protein